MVLPIILIGAAVVAAGVTVAALATDEDNESGNEEVLRNQRDAKRQAQREEAERQRRARQDSVLSDARQGLHRIADRHKSSGRRVASPITFETLQDAIPRPGGPNAATLASTALNLLLPMKSTSRNRNSKDRRIAALSKEIDILHDLLSAVADIGETLNTKALSKSVSRIRRLERKLSALGAQEEDQQDILSQNIDDLVRQAAVDANSPVCIVVCGLLCAGKSSLLNALTDQLLPEFFATGGGRTTRDCKAHVLRLADNDCRFVDTPGINAAADDDDTATRETVAADHLLFVHTLATGELHKAEIDFLETVVSNVAVGDSIPCLTVVLTHRETHEEDAERLTTSILAQVEDVAGQRVPCFCTSATVYKKGRVEDKQLLRELSGIEALRSHCTEIVRDREQTRAGRIARVQRRADRTLIEIGNLVAERKCQRKCLVQERTQQEVELKEDLRRFLEGMAERMETV